VNAGQCLTDGECRDGQCLTDGECRDGQSGRTLTGLACRPVYSCA